MLKKRLERTLQKATVAQRVAMEQLLAHCQYKEDSKAMYLTCKLFLQDSNIFCASCQSLRVGAPDSFYDLNDSMESMASFGSHHQAMNSCFMCFIDIVC